MAAPAAAAAAAASGPIVFRVLDVFATPGRPSFDHAAPTKSFDPDAHTFLDVVQWHLDTHPDDRDKTMRVGQQMLGTDVSLDTPLRDWMRILDMRVGTPVPIHLSNIMSYPIEYEKIKYALAARAAGLAWPLWDKNDTDPINMQVMGTYDNYRARGGGVATEREEDNGIRNLIGLRRGRHLKFVNMHALSQSLVHGHQREPAFQTEIADVNEFARHLLIALQRSASPSQSDPHHTLLPIIDLVTGAVDRRYGSAFSVYERRVKNKPLGEATIRVANHGREQGVAADTDRARSALGQYMEMFMGDNPNATLVDAEAKGLHLRDWIPSTRGFSDADTLQIARDVHGRLNAVVLAATRRQKLATFVRAFLRNHPDIVVADAARSLQKVYEWVAAATDGANFGYLVLLVRDEYARALAGEQPVTPAASPHAAMAAEIHAFVRSNPRISRDELEQGIQCVNKVPLVDVMAIVREEQQRMQQQQRVHPPPADAARNPLIEMYKAAFWAGGQEADPVDNARAPLEAIRAGGLALGVVRAFQRMLQSASDIHVQFEDVADRDARRRAMIVAIHARFPAGGEEEEAEPMANRQATRMERQLRW